MLYVYVYIVMLIFWIYYFYDPVTNKNLLVLRRKSNYPSLTQHDFDSKTACANSFNVGILETRSHYQIIINLYLGLDIHEDSHLLTIYNK